MNALAQAINSSGAGVSATVLNLGSPSAPDYHLSLQSTALGNIAIQLNDGTQDLLTTLSTGTPAQYQVNGQPSTPISSDSSTVTLAPGSAVNLAGDGANHGYRGERPYRRRQRPVLFRIRLQPNG